jgi:DNA helicase IV
MPTSNYDERAFPSSVTVNKSADLDAQAAKAIKAIELQMKAYLDEEFAILCLKAVLRKVWEGVSRSTIATYAILQSSEDGYVPFEDGKPVCVCSVHGAKGLEFRTVHLLDAENVGKSPLRRNITYTAVARAKTSLGIYHGKPLPPYLDSALNVICPPVATAKLDQRFGSK